MSTLIIGGLFVLALIALVGVVFLVRSGPHTPKTRITKMESEPVKVLEAAEIAASGAPAQPNLPSLQEEPVPEPQVVQYLPVGRSQFHTLSIELHALQGQAQKIEHSLNILTEVIESIEHGQNHAVNLEEEVPLTVPAEPAATN